ncbi:MAG: NUDIX domain-containing protein [Candidatus Komeilibacteria bacterium]|jgi:isopentenyldiphosphate isomerase|nr:NUDIX domain-containing protein [Candidatus Komeilibacteria bacterium]MBT4447610.1 NUDIX domain-containing protein [Candidatus Komeilibacteria bacterium]
MSEQTIIVDKDDKIIGYKSRKDLQTEDIYRVSALWLTNSKGAILLAQRAHNRTHHPGKWGPAAAGTIEKGETYNDNIIKEAEEEIGLVGVDFKKGPKELNLNYYNHWTQWYGAVVDASASDFIIQQAEVVEVRWFTKQEIEEKLVQDINFFTPNFPHYFKLFNK